MRTLATSTSRAGGMAPTSCTRKMAQHPESGYLLGGTDLDVCLHERT